MEVDNAACMGLRMRSGVFSRWRRSIRDKINKYGPMIPPWQFLDVIKYDSELVYFLLLLLFLVSLASAAAARFASAASSPHEYVDDCASFLLKGASEKADYLGQIFKLAELYQNVSVPSAVGFGTPFLLSAQEKVVHLALRLWAVNRLLMKGWEIYGHERLGMKIVDRIESPLHGSVPAPRVLQNQLDHLLEYEIVETERCLLKRMQRLPTLLVQEL